MVKLFSDRDIDCQDSVIFTVPSDRYSTEVAVQILKQLEADPDCKILDNGWKSSGCGNLVENGILIRLRTIKLAIICSYEDLIVRRVSGSKREFYRFCESIINMDFDPNISQ